MTTESLNRIWSFLSRTCTESLRMTAEEEIAFSASRVAKLVGLLPFIATCDEADRTALSHLAILVQANRGFARSIYDHRPSDDIDPLARLKPISDFSGGDRAVIEKGMALLGLAMLGSYQRDIEADLALGAYNPLASGAWDFGGVKAVLLSKAAPANEAMDAIMTADEAVTVWWQT